jgi:hypothetical protein
VAELNGQPGELRFTIEVKRAATGETETYEMVGKVTDEPEEEDDNGRNP